MDAVLAPTKDAVVERAKTFTSIGEGEDALLKRAAGRRFYNVSPWTFPTLLNDDKNLARYIVACPGTPTGSWRRTTSTTKIARLDRAGLLYAVVADFADLDVRPSIASNEAMGYIFETLLRKVSAGVRRRPKPGHRLPVLPSVSALFVVLFGQDGADEADDRCPVGEDADDVGAASDFAVQPRTGRRCLHTEDASA